MMRIKAHYEGPYTDYAPARDGDTGRSVFEAERQRRRCSPGFGTPGRRWTGRGRCYPAALVRSREDTAAGPVLFSICWTVKPMAGTITSAALAFVVHEWLA